MSSTLFIAGLSWTTTEETLRKYFTPIASVVSVRLTKDARTGKSKGYAFVEFQSPDIANKVMRQCDGKNCDGRTMRIDIAKEEPAEPCKLYVSGLPQGISEEALIRHLSAAGQLVSAKIAHEAGSASNRGFAFVETATDEDVETIIDELDGSILNDRRLSIKRARPKREKAPTKGKLHQ